MDFILLNNSEQTPFTQYDKTSTDPVKIFLGEISKYKLLSREEELFHAKAVKTKSPNHQKSRMILFKSNLRLVVSVSKKYMHRGIDMEDLLQEGCMGLYKAIDKYDYDTGYKFSTYAVWWIRQAITRALANNSKSIRIPVHMTNLISKYKKFISDIELKLGRTPTDSEIMLSLGIDQLKLELLQQSMKGSKSLDELITSDSYEDNGSELGKVLSSEEDLSMEAEVSEKYEELYEVIEASSSIDPMCPEYLRLFFGIDSSSPMTVKMLSMKKNRPLKEVSRIIDSGIEYVKANYNMELLND